MTGNGAFTTRPQLAGTFGMVASTHWLASAAGMAVLERGGNAFDAAVAAGLVLQVVEPHLNGPGGEVPVIGVSASDGQPFVLDGQGPAPSAATTALFAGLGLDLIPGTGLLAACVPAAFGTWMLLLERYGTLRLRDVLEYAIGYAEPGLPDASRGERGNRGSGGDLPGALARLSRGLPGRRRPAAGRPLCQSRARGGLPADPDRGRARRTGPGAADRGGQAGVLHRLRRRGDRQLPGPRRGHGRHRSAAPRPPDRRPTWPPGRRQRSSQ